MYLYLYVLLPSNWNTYIIVLLVKENMFIIMLLLCKYYLLIYYDELNVFNKEKKNTLNFAYKWLLKKQIIKEGLNIDGQMGKIPSISTKRTITFHIKALK